MAQPRAGHPYHLYEAIQAQPALLETILTGREGIEQAADAIAAKERIIFAGIGTSLHAAQIAQTWMRWLSQGRLWPHFEQSFELVHEGPPVGASDAVIVITHTGTTTYSVEALRAARAAGALTVAITGEMPGQEIQGADFHLETCEQEASFAYTKSYTTALAVLALLILRIIARRNLLSHSTASRALEGVPVLLRQALALEPQVRDFARKAASLNLMNIFGSSVAWPTAREAALKIKEACYIAAEGFETEELLHGPFSEMDSRAAIIAILTGGRSDDRARQILRAAGELEMLRAAITVPSADRDLSAEHIFIVPEYDEWLAAFVPLVPLQLLTYFMALERGLNPDSGRQDQAAHAAARRHYSY
jgi:glutamine---fructose-6-phosphate transaminase (isomerizing)